MVGIPLICHDEDSRKLVINSVQLDHSQSMQQIERIELPWLEGHGNFDQIGAYWGVLRAAELTSYPGLSAGWKMGGNALGWRGWRLLEHSNLELG